MDREFKRLTKAYLATAILFTLGMLTAGALLL